MKKRRLVFALVGSLVLLSAAVVVLVDSLRYDRDQAPPTRDDGYTAQIGGELPMTWPTFKNVTKWSDIVVLGEVTATSSELAPCCNSMATRVATHFPNSPGPTFLVETITLSVQSAYKGSAPAVLTIKTPKPGGTVGMSGDEELEIMDFQVGRQYVLFLVERADHYKVQGVSKGMWAVDVDVATLVGTGESFSPAQLREKVEAESR